MNEVAELFDGQEAEQLTFEDRDGESFERTQDAGVVITPRTRFLFRVALTDKPREDRTFHLVQYCYDDGAMWGRCTCKGFKFYDGPCAHLWGTRLAETHGTIEVFPLAAALDDGKRCPVCHEVPEEVARHV